MSRGGIAARDRYRLRQCLFTLVVFVFGTCDNAAARTWPERPCPPTRDFRLNLIGISNCALPRWDFFRSLHHHASSSVISLLGVVMHVEPHDINAHLHQCLFSPMASMFACMSSLICATASGFLFSLVFLVLNLDVRDIKCNVGVGQEIFPYEIFPLRANAVP